MRLFDFGNVGRKTYSMFGSRKLERKDFFFFFLFRFCSLFSFFPRSFPHQTWPKKAKIHWVNSPTWKFAWSSNTNYIFQNPVVRIGRRSNFSGISPIALPKSMVETEREREKVRSQTNFAGIAVSISLLVLLLGLSFSSKPFPSSPSVNPPLFFFFWFFLSFYFSIHSLVVQRLFTAQELALHNGANDSLPILLAILGYFFSLHQNRVLGSPENITHLFC